MKVRFLGQPLKDFGEPCVEWLNAALEDVRIDQLEIASAWLRRSGVDAMASSLASLRSRGTASLLVGIDFGNTTRQGLSRSLLCFDIVRVYHEPGSRTFHPKVYLAHGPGVASLLVGSSNLTAGGLSNNYEAALAVDLNLNEPDDAALFGDIRAWLEALYDDGSSCRQLDEDLLASILNDHAYSVGDELAPSTRPAAGAYEGESKDTLGESLFGSSDLDRHGLQGSPASSGPHNAGSDNLSAATGSPDMRVKVLTRNDLGSNDSHQAGPLIPLGWLEFFPALSSTTVNPRASVEVTCIETGRIEQWEYIYYNGKLHGTSTRNERRLTRSGGYFTEVHAEPGDRLELTRTGPASYRVRVIK